MKFDSKKQQNAVNLVLGEMKCAETFFSNLGATWIVSFSNAYCLDIHYNGQAYVEDMEYKYDPKHMQRYRLANAFYNTDDIGVPLAVKTLFGYNMRTKDPNYPFLCKFGRIDFKKICTNQFKQDIHFVNNGDITLYKYSHYEKNPHVKWRWFSYNILYNVLNDGFKLEGCCQLTAPSSPEEDKTHLLDVCFKDNILTIKIDSDNIEIIHNLSTGTKEVRITKKGNIRNKIFASFEATFNADDVLEKAGLSIYTHKRNGKINGTYRFDVNRKKGIRAFFYSKKGVKFDLRTYYMLFDTLDTLLPSILSDSIGDIVISDFLASLKSAIYNNQFEEFVDTDCIDFDINLIIDAENRAMEMIADMQDELPLSGLAYRVNELLEQYGKERKSDDNRQRRLALRRDKPLPNKY